MSIFNNIKRENNLDAAQIDDLANIALGKLSEKYNQFSLRFDEHGVSIFNFEGCTEEETGGWTKEQIENSLTDEMLKEMNSLIS